MNLHHLIARIFWIMIGVYVAVNAYYLDLGHFYQPGPGLIFFLVALLLIILGIIDLAEIFIGTSKWDKEEEPIWSGVLWKNVLLVLTLLSAYVYFLSVLGFLLSTFLLMVFLFKAGEPTRWWIAIVSGLITIFFSYGIFKIWLKVPFPRGILGF